MRRNRKHKHSGGKNTHPSLVLATFAAVIEVCPYLFFLAFAFGFLFASLTAPVTWKGIGCPQGVAVAPVISAPHFLHFGIATFLLNYLSTSRLVFPR